MAPPAVPGPDKPGPPIDGKDPLALALAEARRSGKRVEITAKQTETDTTWANPDGTLTTDVAAGPVRLRRGGGFVPVDPTLISQAGVVAPRAAKGGVRLSGGGSGADLASLGSPGARLGMRWPGVLPVPKLSGDTATYAEVVAGADLVVKALTTGYEVFLVLRQRPAEAPVIRLPLALDGLRLAQQGGGRLSLTDASGAEVAGSPAPVMTSAARDPRADEPTQSRVIPTTVETTKAGPELVLRPDAAFLADPATVYPVTIDPAGTCYGHVSVRT